MTKSEKALLDELKEFFTKKYGKDEWESKFKSYTKKLVSDKHLDQEVIDEYLEDSEPDEIVKRFKKFMKETPRTFTPSSSNTSGCGSSGSSYSSGCGGSSRPTRSYGGCGGGGYSSRGGC